MTAHVLGIIGSPLQPEPSVTWTSLSPSVATVDPVSGVVTGVTAGTAMITATATTLANVRADAVPVTVTLAAPTLTSVAPSSGAPGTTVAVTLTGTNFVSGATSVAVSGTGVTASNVSVVSSTSLTANFVIAASATLGSDNVTVTTAGGTSDTQRFVVGGLTMTINAGNNQSVSENAAYLGPAAPVSPSVIVRDANGNPVAGVRVDFVIPKGNSGSLLGGAFDSLYAGQFKEWPEVTDANGIATITWMLGGPPGKDTLLAESFDGGFPGDSSSVTFTATVMGLTIAINAGNDQSAPVGTVVPISPSVIVKDANGSPVAGVIVSFGAGSVADGNGTLCGPSPIANGCGSPLLFPTNASGIAEVSWTLGSRSGTQTVVSVSNQTIFTLGLSSVTFIATGTGLNVAINADNNRWVMAAAPVPIEPSAIARDATNKTVAGASFAFFTARAVVAAWAALVLKLR